MQTLTDTLKALRTFNLEGALKLRPQYPSVVIQLDQDGIALVRLGKGRHGQRPLEAHEARALEAAAVPSSIFEAGSPVAESLGTKLGELFETTGTRPGRVSVVLPDNLAKITLLQLPERPASARQLNELVRAKMRRAVPFRLDEASLAYQLLPGEDRRVAVLVVLVRKILVERFENALERCGARPGLVDVCTPNLINLCREELKEASCSAGDAALLNCTRNYFSLAIFRKGQLIFFRCKSFSLGEAAVGEPNGVMVREINNSFSYYREKLAGEGVHAVFVRSTANPKDQVTQALHELGCERIEPLDPRRTVPLSDGVTLDAEQAQRIAPAIGAAAGRS